MKKEISPVDIIRTFYTANERVGELFKIKNPKRKIIDKKLKSIIKEMKKISDKYLLRYHLDNFHPRYDNYIFKKGAKKNNM